MTQFRAGPNIEKEYFFKAAKEYLRYKGIENFKIDNIKVVSSRRFSF